MFMLSKHQSAGLKLQSSKAGPWPALKLVKHCSASDRQDVMMVQEQQETLLAQLHAQEATIRRLISSTLQVSPRARSDLQAALSAPSTSSVHQMRRHTLDHAPSQSPTISVTQGRPGSSVEDPTPMLAKLA